MRILIDTTNVPMPVALQAELARGVLRGVVEVNRVLLRLAKKVGKPYPPLYKSGVEYRPEPWTGITVHDNDGEEWDLPGIDEFANVRTVYQRGWGDCDDLCAWRLAELLEAGQKADARIYWRYFVPDSRAESGRRRVSTKQAIALRKKGVELIIIMHCEVRFAPGPGEKRGRIEDPSRFLGL
jgi:hypothetical protein